MVAVDVYGVGLIENCESHIVKYKYDMFTWPSSCQASTIIYMHDVWEVPCDFTNDNKDCSCPGYDLSGRKLMSDAKRQTYRYESTTKIAINL